MKRTKMGLAIALLAIGCGGKAEYVDGADGGDDGGADRGHDGGADGSAEGGRDDGGGVCSALPSGCVRTSATTCQLDCNTCSCSGSGWGCTLIACQHSCPISPPAFGSACPSNGQQCNYGPGCGPQCTCENGAWRCVEPPCPPPVCPPSPPTGACFAAGMQCSWGSGCNLTTCDCVAMNGSANWECFGTACVDAGHTGDAGH